VSRTALVAVAAVALTMPAAYAQERQGRQGREGCAGSLCGSGTRPSAPINSIKELHQAFFTCFKWPSRFDSYPGMEITILFSLNKAGEILGEPRFTFLTPNVTTEVRAVYQRAVADAFKICTPFPLTESMGAAVAGRPQALRFTDTRGQRKA
jgi:hypothetical protein